MKAIATFGAQMAALSVINQAGSVAPRCIHMPVPGNLLGPERCGPGPAFASLIAPLLVPSPS